MIIAYLFLGLFSFSLLIYSYISFSTIYVGALFTHLLLWVEVMYLMYVTLRANVGSYALGSLVAFSYLFLIIAPAFQLISYDGRLVNTMSFDEMSVMMGNAQFIVFYMGCILSLWRRDETFLFGRNFVGFRSSLIEKDLPIARKIDFFKALVFLICSVISLVVTIGITADIVIEKTSTVNDLVMSPVYLIQTKFIGFLPIPIFLTVVFSHKDKVLKNPIWFFVFWISLLGVLISQNPILEKRQSIGPVYLSIIAAFLIYRVKSGLARFLFIFGSVVFVMPLLSILTHVNYSEWDGQTLTMGLIYDHFLETHYDAWANAVAASELVSQWGLYWGHQLIGGILFWVPRDIWLDKPMMSGVEIARYLESYYSMWFDNISAPLATEGFIDFWFFGAFVYGWLFVLLCVKLDAVINYSKSPVVVGGALFFSFFLIFLLRGALMNAVAYGVGNMLAFALINYIDRYFGRAIRDE